MVTAAQRLAAAKRYLAERNLSPRVPIWAGLGVRPDPMTPRTMREAEAQLARERKS